MSEPSIQVHVNGDTEDVVTAEEVRHAVRETAAEEEMAAGEFSVTFVGRDRMRELNRTYLGRSEPTDVIAFDLGEPGAPLGDIYVCPSVARSSAGEYGVEVREELLRLVVHGTLHVLGHHHPEGGDRAASEMFRRQERILERLGRT